MGGKLRYLLHKTVLGKWSSTENHEELFREMERPIAREGYFVVTFFPPDNYFKCMVPQNGPDFCLFSNTNL